MRTPSFLTASSRAGPKSYFVVRGILFNHLPFLSTKDCLSVAKMSAKVAKGCHGCQGCVKVVSRLSRLVVMVVKVVNVANVAKGCQGCHGC